MAKAFERAAEEHPVLMGTATAVVIYFLFAVVGGIERGSLPLPF